MECVIGYFEGEKYDDENSHRQNLVWRNLYINLHRRVPSRTSRTGNCLTAGRDAFSKLGKGAERDHRSARTWQ
jgi:hypothetical protein